MNKFYLANSFKKREFSTFSKNILEKWIAYLWPHLFNSPHGFVQIMLSTDSWHFVIKILISIWYSNIKNNSLLEIYISISVPSLQAHVHILAMFLKLLHDSILTWDHEFQSTLLLDMYDHKKAILYHQWLKYNHL